MTTSFALKIFFEIGLVMLIVYGYKNEDKLIAFEAELFAILKFAFRKYVLKNSGKRTNARRSVQAAANRAAATNKTATANSVAQGVSAPVYSGTGTAATRRVRAEIKAFPVSNTNRNVA